MQAFDREDTFDPEDCVASLEEDWLDDAAGKDYMDENDFFSCWFQLADLSTDSVDVDECTCRAA